MSQRDHTRSCPSCERELSGREHFGEGGLTVIWKCVCGWGSARTVPAVTGSRAELPPPTSAARMSVREPSVGGEMDGGMDIRIRKSSGVRARPIDERAQVEAGGATPREQVESANASRVRRKSDG